MLLDAFGDRLDRQRLAELHEHVHERLGLGRFADAGDERTIDLQHVDREPAQVRERRVAGAEVVDRDPHAERLELGEPSRGVVGVAHGDALGDLERQAARFEPGRCERLVDVDDERVVVELLARRR